MRKTLSLLCDSLKSSIFKPFQHPGVLLAITPIYALQWFILEYFIEYSKYITALNDIISNISSSPDNPFTMPLILIIAMKLTVFTIKSIFIAIISTAYKYPDTRSLISKFRLSLSMILRKTFQLTVLLIEIGGIITIGLSPLGGEGSYTILALVIPGLYLTTIFSLTIPAFILEEKGIIASLKRSYNLMKEHKLGFLLFSVTMVAATTIIGFSVDFASANLIDYLDSIHSFLLISLFDLLVQSSLFIIKASILFEFYNRLIVIEKSQY